MPALLDDAAIDTALKDLPGWRRERDAPWARRRRRHRDHSAHMTPNKGTNEARRPSQVRPTGPAMPADSDRAGHGGQDRGRGGRDAVPVPTGVSYGEAGAQWQP